ncbi:10380_t:CDS:1, partial [Racocetra fulgida]
EFVSDKVWKNVLQMHLRATDQAKLRKMPEILTKLGVFVCQVIKAVLIAQDKKKYMQIVIKKCDEYTIDLEIPTKLGIVKLLLVQELLD